MLRLIALVVCLSACSTTHVVGQPITVEAVEQLKVEALDSAVIVDYAAGIAPRRSSENGRRPEPAQDERIQSAESVLTAASLDWMTFGTGTDGYQRIASSRVRRLRLDDHGRGAINGLFYGLLSGAAAGALVGAIVGSGGCTQTSYGYYTTTQCPSTAGSILRLGLEGGLGGALIGTLVGAAFGYRTTFVF